jgi:hypothetical protein
LSQSIGDVASTIESTTSQLARMQQSVDAVMEESGVVIDDWLEHGSNQLADVGLEVDQFLATIDETIETFIDAVDGFEEVLTATLDELEEQMQTAVDGVQDLAIVPITEAVNELQQFTEALTDRLVEEVTPTIVDTARTEVIDELRAALGRRVKAFCASLDDLADMVLASIERGSAGRGALQPALDVLRPAVDAVMAELERIRDLASTVGVSV